MNNTAAGMIYLLSCAANGTAPDAEKVGSMDLEKIFKLCRRLSVSAAVGSALAKGGIQNDLFSQALNLSIRKNILFDNERGIILAELEKRGIWYLPLKGTVIKEIYPEYGMREMADVDILYDKSRQAEVKDIMVDFGYKVEYYDYTNHDVYTKPPYIEFEMHMELFSPVISKGIIKYYANVKDHLVKDKDNNFGYHFSDNDFYIFLTAHEYKHYSQGGTGIRSLLDSYVFLKYKGDSLDWDYIGGQMELLGISEFEKRRRELAVKVFASGKVDILDVEEQALLKNYLSNGTYGSLDNRVKNELEGRTKLSFWLHKVFLSKELMEQSVRFTKKSILLYPVGFVWRAVRILLFRKSKLAQTIKAVKKNGK